MSEKPRVGRLRGFIEWLFGPLSDSYTWLVLLCIGAGITLVTVHRWPGFFAVLGVEVLTLAVDRKTR